MDRCYNCIINPDKFDDLDGDYSKDKQKHLRMWKEYNKDKDHIKLIQDIVNNK